MFLRSPHFTCSLTCSLTALMAVGLLNLAAQDAAPYTKEIFKDDFSAAQLGKEWKLYKAESKVENGVLIAAMPDGGDHSAVHGVVTPPLANVEFAMSFRFEGGKKVDVTFNDKDYKGSHAGHLARVSISNKEVTIRDEKTGIFKNEIYAMEKKDAATLELLKTKTKSFPVELSPSTWYKLLVRVEGDSIIVTIEDKEIGRFASEGFAHATKTKPAIVVPGKYIHIDHVVIRAP